MKQWLDEVFVHGFAHGSTAKQAGKKPILSGAVNLQLSPEEIRFLEEAYQQHVLTGIMAQNTPQTKDAKQVWTR